MKTMKDLSTTYLGLKLKTPIIVGSCGLTKTVDSIGALADNKAGAVVLKSLFEEQIEAELVSNLENYQSDYPDAFDYIRGYTRENAVAEYLDLIADAKKAVDIPIIASINCVSGSEWVAFAKSVEKAGADALELNVSLLPSDPRMNCQDSEKHYFDIVDKVSGMISIPLSLKMSSYSSALANLVVRLSWTNKVAGFVLFNRYYRPDVDINKVAVTKADIFSTPSEMTESLRWIALLSTQIEKDLAASTGIHDSDGLIKQVLVGAAAVQVVTALYKNGPGYIGTLLQGLESWMTEKGYGTLADFRGLLSYRDKANPAAFERIQFMKQFGGIA
jgi:dihydroorotate dehydrogenase (fumarate)